LNFETLWWEDGKVKIIDQTKLPNEYIIRECSSAEDMFDAIRILAVRGAPLLGVAGAFGLYLGIKDYQGNDSQQFMSELDRVAAHLGASRPTAINLSWALNRMKRVARAHGAESVRELKKVLFDEAQALKKEDEILCRKIGEAGEELINDGDVILTHCNAGALATAGIGTALAPLYCAKAKGKNFRVYADETRPLLQGARLTTWELMRNGIDVTLICDNMAASLMKKGIIKKVIVGADRITAHGDTANKIGTYSVAVLAYCHDIPLYVAVPYSTFDFSITKGDDIPIEERSADEVKKFHSMAIAPDTVSVYNPSFDVTPSNLISAFITEHGIFHPPYEESLKKLKKLLDIETIVRMGTDDKK
jgi:methylthioribose-1-phosphate isomerase